MDRFHEEANQKKTQTTSSEGLPRMREGVERQVVSPERSTALPTATDRSLVNPGLQEPISLSAAESSGSSEATAIADEKNVTSHQAEAQLIKQFWDELKTLSPLMPDQQVRIEEATQAVLYWQKLGEDYTTLAQTRSEEEAGTENFQNAATACNQAATAATEFLKAMSSFSPKPQRFVIPSPKIPVATSIPLLSLDQVDAEQEITIRKNIGAAVKDFFGKSALEGDLSANCAWEALQQGKEQQLRLYNEFKIAEQEEILFQKIFEECDRASAEEELAKTRLGRIQKYASKIATALNAIPTPPTQLVGHGAALVGGGAGLLNNALAEHHKNEAKENYEAAIQKRTRSQKKDVQARQHLLLLEETATQQEQRTPELARESILRFAAQLAPDEQYGESEWQTWSRMVASSPEEVMPLAAWGKRKIGDVRKMGFEAWHAALIDQECEFEKLKQEGTSHVVTLKQQYLLAKQSAEEAAELVTSCRAAWESDSKRNQELSQWIDHLLEEMETQEHKDAEKFQNAQNLFMKAMRELNEVKQALPQQREAWEQALREESDSTIRRNTCFWAHRDAKMLFERQITRALAKFEAAKAGLIRYWPEEKDHLYVPYNAMALPFPEEEEVSFFHDNPTPAHEEREIGPPLLRREEEEAQGKRYLYEAKKKIKQSLSVTTPSSTAAAAAVSLSKTAVPAQTTVGRIGTFTRIKTIQEQAREAAATLVVAAKFPTSVVSAKIIQTPEEKLLQWTLAQVEHPSLADQQRWKLFSQYENARRQNDQLLRTIREANAEESFSTDERPRISSWSDAASAASSWITSLGRKSSQQTIWASTTGTRSAISTSDRSANSFDPIKLEEQLRQAAEAEHQAKDSWEEAARQAEQERLAHGGEIIEDDDVLKTWSYVDRAAVKKQQRQQRQDQHEFEMEKMINKKLINNARWRACKIADEATLRFHEAEKERQNFETSRTSRLQGVAFEQKATSLRIKMNDALEAVVQTKEAWKELAMQHYSLLRAQADELCNDEEELSDVTQREIVAKALEKLRGFDRGVVQRWNQFQEKQAHTLPVDHGEGESDEKLTADLTLAEEKIFSSSTTFQEGARNYQQLAIAKALSMARNNTPGAPMAWEQRLREKEEQLEKWKQALADPKMESHDKTGFEATLPRLKAIVKADRKAKDQFEKEKNRLDELEWHWKNIIEKQEEDHTRHIAGAAMAYHQGNKSFWEGLTMQEREKYNNPIRKGNHDYDHTFEEEEMFLKDLKQRIDQEFERTRTFTDRVARKIFTLNRAAKNALLQAQSHFEQRWEDLQQRKAEREEVLRWSKMSSSERVCYVSEKILEQLNLAISKREEERRLPEGEARKEPVKLAEGKIKKERLQEEKEQAKPFLKKADALTISKFLTEINDQVTGCKFVTCADKDSLRYEIQKLRGSLDLVLLPCSSSNIRSSILVHDALERVGITEWDSLITAADEAFQKLVATSGVIALEDFINKERALISDYEARIRSMALEIAGTRGEEYWIKFVILSDRTAQLAEYANEYSAAEMIFQRITRLRAIANANRLAWYHTWPQTTPVAARIAEITKLASASFKDLAVSPNYIRYYQHSVTAPFSYEHDRLLCTLEEKAAEVFRTGVLSLLLRDTKIDSLSKIYWDQVARFFKDEASNCQRYGLRSGDRGLDPYEQSRRGRNYYAFFNELGDHAQFKIFSTIKRCMNEVWPEAKTKK